MRSSVTFIALRLDRAVYNDLWIDHLNLIICYTWVRHLSHHHILLINQEHGRYAGHYSLKSYQTSFSHEDCIIFIANNWNIYAKGNPIRRPMSKTKR